MANKSNRETFVIEPYGNRYYVWGYDHKRRVRTLYSTGGRTMEEAEAEKALLEAGQHSTQTEPGGRF